MTLPEVPPGFLFLAGMALLPLFPRAWRPAVFLLFPAAALAWIPFLEEGALLSYSLVGYDLILLQVDPLSRGFGLAFSLAALAGGIYAMHVRDLRQQVAALGYIGGSLGVTFAGDFLTLLFFWEVMAVTSALLVWAGGTREAEGAGFRYLIVHLLGGSLLLAGVIFLYRETGSLELGAFAAGTGSPAVWLILLGVLVNAAAPPLHAWVPDSYTRATATGAIFLNAFTTKVAVYVLAQCFPGWPLLFWLGIFMALYGVYYAVLANDIRLILSYHIISQVGYMLVGIGYGGEFGVSAGAAHAYNNIIYKTLLFMGTGAVLHTIGRTRLTDLGGLAGRMPGVVALYLVGAFAISGFPLFSGFVSKAMILEGVDGIAMYLLLLAAVGTFLSVGLKLTYYTWFYRDVGLEPERGVPGNMYAAMVLLAVPCLVFGFWPEGLFVALPYAIETFQPYSIYLVVEAIQLPLFTFAAFWIFRNKVLGDAKIALDTDWFYRKPAPVARLIFLDGIYAFFAWADRQVSRVVYAATDFARNPTRFRRPVHENYDPDRQREPLGTNLALALVLGIILSVILFW